MPLPKGTIQADILDDGTVRSETGDMGGVTHAAADNFLKLVQQLMGGAVSEAKVAQGHHHTQGHGHDHQHH